MVEQTARRSIRSVDRAEETPTLGEQLSDCRCFELGEEATSVDHAEMADEAVKVDLFGHDGESRSLLQIETTGTDKVACRQKVVQ